MTIAPLMTMNMTREQQAVFYTQMSLVQKDELLGVLLAFFLGSFGAHHFYLRQNGLGILYLLFFWTGIPGLISLIECFFMPGRVRRFNALYAGWIAAYVRGAAPYYLPSIAACRWCGVSITAGSRFCTRCGATVTV